MRGPGNLAGYADRCAEQVCCSVVVPLCLRLRRFQRIKKLLVDPANPAVRHHRDHVALFHLGREVIDDRIRENMRKFRKMEMRDLIDLSVNETLPRTVMTSVTIMLALAALLLFGGHVLRGFTAAMMLGIVVGTYSSIYVSSSLLITLGLKPGFREERKSSAPDGERVAPRDLP